VFANIVLADEINRTPPKTQSALLEAMQEHRVTAAGRVFPLPSPFFVLATQNPIEQEGLTPCRKRNWIASCSSLTSNTRTGRGTPNRPGNHRRGPPALTHLIHGEQIIHFQEIVQRVPVPDHIYDTAVDWVRLTRPKEEGAPDWIKKWVTWGAGPRAVQYLIRGAKATPFCKAVIWCGWKIWKTSRTRS
jgi:MoxR-like ATPase